MNSERTWVEFEDPDDPERMFRCDATWLTSRWNCIFGRGCHGIYRDQPDDGCCVLGAHFTDKDDRKRVKKAAKLLSQDDWQYYDDGHEAGIIDKNDEGERQTRVVDGACIFLNRPGFAGGTGCALHSYALTHGHDPEDLKPEVCWQVPIRRYYSQETWADDSSVQVVVIAEFDRRSWGPGGHDLDWYCSGSPEAHTATMPVYRTEAAALTRLMGPAAYQRLVTILDEHPAVIQHPATLIAEQVFEGRAPSTP